MKLRPLTRIDALVIAARFIFWIVVWRVSATYIEMDNDGIRAAFFFAVVALAFGTHVLIREWVEARE